MIVNAFQKTYASRCVLDFPGMDLERGHVYAVIGANGSGKSTFGRILAQIEPADGKKKPFAGHVSVGYMLQKNYAFQMTVRQNILLNSRKTDEDRKRAEQLMEATGLSHLADENAQRLSGGETARMAVARILMQHYDVLVLDEPTAAMDVEATLKIERLVTEYCHRNNAVVIVITHALKQAMRMADSVLFFKDGMLTEQGDAQQVLTSPQKNETRQFIEFYSL